MPRAARRSKKSSKVVDVEHEVKLAAGRGLRREEVWTDEFGNIVRYNLALICHQLCGRDNGRVLGYDNRHGVHHRHHFGSTEVVAYESYEQITARFYGEMAELRKAKR